MTLHFLLHYNLEKPQWQKKTFFCIGLDIAKIHILLRYLWNYRKSHKKLKRKIPAPWLNDASNQGGLWFYNFRQRARSQALFRGPRALWSMRGPPKEKGVHFKIFQSTYIVLSFCCIAAAEKKNLLIRRSKKSPKTFGLYEDKKE